MKLWNLSELKFSKIKNSVVAVTFQRLNNSRVCMLSHFSHVCSLQPWGPQPSRLLYPWNSLSKNTGVGCRALLQGIFPTQGSNQVSWVSCIARWFFTTSATCEVLNNSYCISTYRTFPSQHKVLLNRDALELVILLPLKKVILF